MEAERALAATHNLLLLPLRREAVTRPEAPTPLQYKPTDRQPFPRLLDKDVNRTLENLLPKLCARRSSAIVELDRHRRHIQCVGRVYKHRVNNIGIGHGHGHGLCMIVVTVCCTSALIALHTFLRSSDSRIVQLHAACCCCHVQASVASVDSSCEETPPAI